VQSERAAICRHTSVLTQAAAAAGQPAYCTVWVHSATCARTISRAAPCCDANLCNLRLETHRLATVAYGKVGAVCDTHRAGLSVLRSSPASAATPRLPACVPHLPPAGPARRNWTTFSKKKNTRKERPPY